MKRFIIVLICLLIVAAGGYVAMDKFVDNNDRLGSEYAEYKNKPCIPDLHLSGEKLNVILMNKRAKSVESKTEYLALVNCTTHRVGIYQGSKDNWQIIKYYKCGDGKPDSPTIRGEFETGPQSAPSNMDKIPYFDSEGGRLWYVTRIEGPYLFHSVLYKIDKEPKEIMDGTVGKAVSHGCIRLKLENAKWIYDNIPQWTKVIIYDDK